MSIGLFTRKIGMTQVFDKDGALLPVTILRAEPCKISQIKTIQTDGYNAVQVAYCKEKFNKLTQAQQGHLKNLNGEGFKFFGEFRVKDPNAYKLGQTLNVQDFEEGQTVRLTGKTIGKGFTGNQKRHNFSRGPMTHGSKNHRLPGSIGAGSTPGRVYPGKKMGGHLGNANVTLKNTKIIYVNEAENILVVKGSVPGKRNNILKLSAPKTY